MFPQWLEAVILGIVQGLTEFIPVSSSGHLVLVPYLLGWEKQSLAFDVMMHVGTLGAVLLYFRGELIAITRGLLRLDTSEQGRTYRRVGLFIVPASVPVAIVGVTLEERVAGVFETPLAAALLLVVTAGLLFALEAVRSRRVRAAGPVAPARAATTQGARAATGDRAWSGDWRDGDPLPDAPGVADRTAAVLPTGVDPADPRGTGLADLSLRQAMSAGLLQCLALLPGVSRSGATIAGGVFAGMTREAATRFSFLLVIPALVGATIISLPDLGEAGETATELALGMLAAFASGYVAIRFLVGLVSRERVTGFAWYCLAAATIGVIGYLMIGPPSSV